LGQLSEDFGYASLAGSGLLVGSGLSVGRYPLGTASRFIAHTPKG
jgi:hypothetical protein